MEKKTVLLEAPPFSKFDDTALRDLQNSDCELVDMRGSGIENPKFMEVLARAEIVLCGNDLQVNEELLNKAPKLKAIAKIGTGLDTVDVDAASNSGVLVFHTPGINNQAVADHTFALIFALARKIPSSDRGIRDKKWEHTNIMGMEIWQKTIGIIGLGAIGQNVALRAKGFQMRIVAFDPYWPADFAKEHGIERVELDELLRVSDLVSIHSPLTATNKRMINKSSFDIMKPNALLINVARGGLVDEDDLYEALKAKKIAGAGIDVFEVEPPVESGLLELDNTILTPHIAAFTEEAMNNMSSGIAKQTIEFLEGEMPAFAVNSQAF